MRHEKVFRDFTSIDGRLGFYTKETRGQIPEIGGCYAWFLPLWFYRTDLDELIKLVNAIVHYDHQPEKYVEAQFTWESIKLLVRRGSRVRDTQRIDAVWKQALENDSAKEILQQTMLEASLLMPPLYVGKAANLRKRYVQHTEGRGEGNVFHSRFAECVERLRLSISVSDLLFVCVKTPKELIAVLRDAGITDPEELIEQILMRFCRPPFSIR